jgi:hypothetical protein
MIHAAAQLRRHARAVTTRAPAFTQGSRTFANYGGNTGQHGHLVGDSTTAPAPDGEAYGSISLSINHQKLDISSGSAALDQTLVQFLRARGDTDVKAVCAEGGCGACSVVIGEWDKNLQQVVHKSVCACLTPVRFYCLSLLLLGRPHGGPICPLPPSKAASTLFLFSAHCSAIYRSQSVTCCRCRSWRTSPPRAPDAESVCVLPARWPHWTKSRS